MLKESIILEFNLMLFIPLTQDFWDKSLLTCEVLYYFLTQYNCHQESEMVEIIHRYHGHYPFGLKKETQNTFMDILKQNLTEEEISLLRQKVKIYRQINNSHLIKLTKMLKEENNLHIIYQYHEISFEIYIDDLKKNLEAGLSRQKYRTIASNFKWNIDQIVYALIKAEIKTDILISNLAFIPRQEKDQAFFLKAFIDPDAQYLSIIDHSYRPKDCKKKIKSQINQQFLHQFYDAEQKRLNLQFEELIERNFGKMIEVIEKKNIPNFVINGTKLVFMNSDDRNNSGQENSTKNSKIDNSNVSNQSKGKNNIKNEEVNKNNSTQQKNNSQCGHSGLASASKKTFEQKQFILEDDHLQAQERRNQRIINFDQSFQPQFKPEQFTKQNTYIFEDNDLLDSLEEQLAKLNMQKKAMEQSKKTANTISQKLKQDEKYHKNSSQYSKNKTISQVQKILEERAKQRANHVSTNQTSQSNQSNSNISSNNNDSSERIPIDRKTQYKDFQVKTQKVNKYKMKIITSHQIEIEGGCQPNVQEIQREIMQGIRSGKLNINQLAATSNNQKLVQTKSQINSPSLANQQSRQSLSASTNIKIQNSESTSQKDLKDINNRNDKFKKQVCKEEDQVAIEKKAAKIKSINDIIEKIGIKSMNSHNNEQKQHNQVKQLGVQSKHSVTESRTSPTCNIAKASSPIGKHQKVQVGEINAQKGEKFDYINKIREAKNKAQQILKEYTTKKKQ